MLIGERVNTVYDCFLLIVSIALDGSEPIFEKSRANSLSL